MDSSFVAFIVALFLAVALIILFKKVIAPHPDTGSPARLIGSIEGVIFLLVITSYLVTEALHIAHHIQSHTLLEVEIDGRAICYVFIAAVASLLIYLSMIWIASQLPNQPEDGRERRDQRKQ